MMMNKKELVKAIADKVDFTQKDVKTVMDALQEVVIDVLQGSDGEDGVKIMDGVTLSKTFRQPREARNPRTGEIISVDGKYAPKCKFGKLIREAINE